MSGGSAELLLVSGYSGIGKSALVNEIHKSIDSSVRSTEAQAVLS